MNIGLLIIGILLSFGLIMEAKEIFYEGIKFLTNQGNYQHFVEEILVPLRYFIYIGITVIIRLIIVQHDDAKSILIWAGAVISLAIAEKYIKKRLRKDFELI